MAPGLGFKGGILGIGEEVVYGTAVARDRFIEMNSDGLDTAEGRIHSAAIPDIAADSDEVAQGAVDPAGSIEFEMRYEGMERLLKHAMGSVDTVEVASFVVGATNKFLDIKEDGGGDLNATLTEATYKMGERGHYEIDATNNKINFKEDGGAELTATLAAAEYATAALLAAQIKTQLEAAGAGTYTVAYSATTNKFSITATAGVTTFQILWKTGTNGADGTDTHPGALLGFLDTKDGIDDTSTTSDYSTFDPDGTLCAEIKTQLEAAGAGTYTVTFSNTTKKITIAVAGVIAATQFLWKTGTHGSDGTDTSAVTLLGFTAGADGASVASVTADSAVVTVFDSTFKLADELPTGLTLEVDRDLRGFTTEGCKIGNISFAQDSAGFLIGTIEVIGEDTNATAVTASTLPTKPLVDFADFSFTYNGAIILTSFDFTLNNNLKGDRRFIGSRLRYEPKRAGKRDVTGSFAAEYENEDQYDDYRAMTSRAIVGTATGAVIKAAITYTLTITFPVCKLTKGVPLMSDESVIMYEHEFKAYSTDSSTRELTIVIRNTLSRV